MKKTKNHRRARLRICVLEHLESRELLSLATLADVAATPAVELGTVKAGAAKPATNSGPPQGSVTPAQIRQAYGVNQLANFPGNLPANGQGQTIAIVDAAGDPNIKTDLQAFDAQYNLPAPPSFKVVDLGDCTTSPDPNWGTETALDVEWAHVVAPGANILLVQTQSGNLLQAEQPSAGPGLLDGVLYAREQPGVSVVSMSWTAPEFLGENSFDSYFALGPSDPGVTFVTAAGNNGPPANWPASAPDVVSVGGTTLQTESNGSYHSELAWSGSGGGISLYETEPSYQYGVQGTGVRTTPDVAYNGDPNTGFPVYVNSAWLAEPVGGTSAGTPQWAGIIAIADEGRAARHESALRSAVADLYQLPATDFHDIANGAAMPGYNLATGRGTPYVNRIVPGLVNSTTNPASTGTSITSVAAQTRVKSALAAVAKVHPRSTADESTSTAPPLETGTGAPGSSTGIAMAAESLATASGLNREDLAGLSGSSGQAAAAQGSTSWPVRQARSTDGVVIIDRVEGADSDAFDSLGPSTIGDRLISPAGPA